MVADEMMMMGDVWVLLQRKFIIPLHHEEAKTFEHFASQ